MGKLILISIVFGPIAVAALCARDPRPVRGLKRMLLLALGFNVVYVLAVLFLYPRLG
jgi:hypothetical protein